MRDLSKNKNMNESEKPQPQPNKPVFDIMDPPPSDPQERQRWLAWFATSTAT